MRIKHCCVERVLVILDGLIVESVHIIHFKEVRRGPVGIAMHNLVDKTAVIVREVVERDGHPVIRAQGDDIVMQPVVIDRRLQGVYHGMVHLV